MEPKRNITYSDNDLKEMDSKRLYGLFHTATWEALDNTTRLAVCQEVENRLAAEQCIEPRHITAEPMADSCYGYYAGDIHLNSHVLEDGVLQVPVTDDNGTVLYTAQYSVGAAGWTTLDTLIHEHTHARQDHERRTPDTYIDPEIDRDLYRIQPIEKEAYREAQEQTLRHLEEAEREQGEDPQRQAYLTSVQKDSYDEASKRAATNYNDPYIGQTVDMFVFYHDRGIQPAGASESYLAIEQAYTSYQQEQAQKQTSQAETDLPGQIPPTAEQGVTYAPSPDTMPWEEPDKDLSFAPSENAMPWEEPDEDVSFAPSENATPWEEPDEDISFAPSENAPSWETADSGSTYAPAADSTPDTGGSDRDSGPGME